MLTPFGKALRKLRIEHSWLLKDMADGIGVASSYLSAVETGRKSIPADLVERISSWGQLNAIEKDELKRAALISTNEVKFKMPRSASNADREAVAILARRFETGVSSDFLASVRELLERNREQ